MRKSLAVLLVILMFTPLASAGVLNGSTMFLSEIAGKTNRTAEISLSLMAISSASKGLNWSVENVVTNLTEVLLSAQNPDGGWGYYLQDTSNVPDTAYAVIALIKAKPNVDPRILSRVNTAIERGVEYLLRAENEVGWGYVPNTSPAFYPTVLSVWALGEYGYSYTASFLWNPVDYIGSAKPEIPEYEALALRVIAYHAVGYPVSNSTVDEIENLLYSGNLTMKERAMLTYALELVNPFDFNTAKLLLELESYAKTSLRYAYWVSTPETMFSSPEVIETTAYALLALSIPAHYVGPISKPTNPYALPCDELLSLQNPDGGWPVVASGSSNEKATYYSLLALCRCYHTNETVNRALSWIRERFYSDGRWMLLNDRFSPGFYYALETLLHYGMLNQSEREWAINVIKESQLDYGIGLWGNDLGPQPYQTALAVKALLDLGVPPSDPLIQKAKDWLLSISKTGWGIYVTTPYFSYMLKPDVLTTLTVIEALENITPKEELMPHVQWLLQQRVDGGWAPFKEYFDQFYNRVVVGKPTVELTVRVTDLLLRFGYNYTNETLHFVLRAKDTGEINGKPVEIAFTIMYLSRYHFIPPVTLYEIENAFLSEPFEVITVGLNSTERAEVINALHQVFGQNFVLSNSTSIGSGYYIVIAPYGKYDVSRYNPYIRFEVTGKSVYLGPYNASLDSIAVIPGATANGMVLFVLYSEKSRWMAVELFTTGFVKYLRGNAMLFTYENGRVKQYVVG
ncbi:prenyltransferase/squalene oxidase repeat-containing protein [Thermococcus sp.]|uniref:prenyltransferase/squalene oxidase repeat-containing protein n=1 Tax=Thermococcus sp. TaxID=35749 RepID=UPI00260DD0DE|nr:prenyltransferase/squalene oxidase repeat-containing protein [Thermococcus sp.]